MPHPVIAVRDRIASDTTIMALLLGGVWDNRVTRKNTPAAYDAHLHLQPVIAVKDDGWTPMPQARGGAVGGKYNHRIQCTIYVPADNQRKPIGRQIEERLVRLLTRLWPDVVDPNDPLFAEPWYFINESGTKMFPRPLGSTGFFDAEEEFFGTQQNNVRFEFSGRRPIL